MDNKIQEVVAFVTGGSSGIGKAIVQRLLEKGGKVVIVDRNTDGEKIAEAYGEKAIFIIADVTSEGDIVQALDQAKRRFGGINVVINCAGIAKRGVAYDFEANVAHSLEIYKRVMDVNALGTFNVTRLAVGVMAANVPDENQQRGLIINIASVMADDPRVDLIAYAASKAAVIGMTLPFARCFAERGIRVVTISPGFVDTPMAAPVLDTFIKNVNIFPKRLGRPEEIAHVAQCIIENPYINAGNVIVSGGYYYGQ